MPQTKPTSEQLTFRSSRTGIHSLDGYLEDAELGDLTIAQLLARLFNPDGTLKEIASGGGSGVPAGSYIYYNEEALVIPDGFVEVTQAQAVSADEYPSLNGILPTINGQFGSNYITEITDLAPDDGSIFIDLSDSSTLSRPLGNRNEPYIFLPAYRINDSQGTPVSGELWSILIAKYNPELRRYERIHELVTDSRSGGVSSINGATEQYAQAEVLDYDGTNLAILFRGSVISPNNPNPPNPIETNSKVEIWTGSMTSWVKTSTIINPVSIADEKLIFANDNVSSTLDIIVFAKNGFLNGNEITLVCPNHVSNTSANPYVVGGTNFGVVRKYSLAGAPLQEYHTTYYAGLTNNKHTLNYFGRVSWESQDNGLVVYNALEGSAGTIYYWAGSDLSVAPIIKNASTDLGINGNNQFASIRDLSFHVDGDWLFISEPFFSDFGFSNTGRTKFFRISTGFVDSGTPFGITQGINFQEHGLQVDAYDDVLVIFGYYNWIFNGFDATNGSASYEGVRDIVDAYRIRAFASKDGFYSIEGATTIRQINRLYNGVIVRPLPSAAGFTTILKV